MTVFLYDHTDLDAAGIEVLLKRSTLADNNILVIYHYDYNEINKRIRQFIHYHEGYQFSNDMLFITDISPNEETAKLLDDFIKKVNAKDEHSLSVRHFDHHKSAVWMKQYEWANLSEDPHDSGTSMFYRYLLKNDLFDTDHMPYGELFNIGKFVENVTDYDTWDWTRNGNKTAKKLNDLFHLIGPKDFVNRFVTDIDPDFTNEEDLILLIEQKKIDKYIRGKESQLIIKRVQDKKAGIVFGDQYLSELGNTLAKNHPELDYVAIINPSLSVSLRSSDEGADVSEVAKIFGGGGHAHSAGFSLSGSFKEELIHLAFEDVIKLEYDGKVL